MRRYNLKKANLVGLLLLLMSQTPHAMDAQEEANYKQGINDGCASGKNAAGNWVQAAKNVDLYVKDPYYKTGWDDAFTKCKADADSINRAIDESIRF